MPSGLLIDLNDGGPTMEITAGLRCPSYCQTTPNDGSIGNTVTISNYIAGSEIVFIPHSTVLSYFVGPSAIPVIQMLNSVSVSGSRMTFNTWANDNSSTTRVWPGNIYQILPASQSGRTGLLIENSTDFTAITTNSVVGQLAWRGRVTINKQWALPSVSGFSRDSYSVFAKWSQSGAVVECDGTNIYVTAESDNPGIGATATIDIVIFGKGPTPTPSTGLNYFNAAGQCTFSTSRRPFVYLGNKYRPTASGVDIGNNMVCLGRYGYDCRSQGDRQSLKYLGLVRTGNTVRTGRGTEPASWTEYPLNGSRVSAVDVLTIPATYI